MWYAGFGRSREHREQAADNKRPAEHRTRAQDVRGGVRAPGTPHRTAAEGRTEEAHAQLALHRRRPRQDPPLRLVRQPGVPESGVHQCHQRLRLLSHPLALVALPQPVVDQVWRRGPRAHQRALATPSGAQSLRDARHRQRPRLPIL